MLRAASTPAMLGQVVKDPAEGAEDKDRPQSIPERRGSSPALCRFRMMAKLSRILNAGTETEAKPEPKPEPKPKPKPILLPNKSGSKLSRLKMLCKMRSMLGREISPRKKPKFDKKKSVYWRRYKKPSDPKILKIPFDAEVVVQLNNKGDPIVEIRLSTDMASSEHQNEVTFDIVSQKFKIVKSHKNAVDLLTIPSKIIHEDDPKRFHLEKSSRVRKEVDAEVMCILVELYGDIVPKEELEKLDSQPNPFNFSERVSQTPCGHTRELAIQTDPPPGTKFSVNANMRDIYDAYKRDHHLATLREQEATREREKHAVKLDRKFGPREPPDISLETHSSPSVTNLESPRLGMQKPNPFDNLPGLLEAAIIVERMLNQNIYDDIVQDFKYWEDGSDEFKPLQGSLLPLWKFSLENGRSLTVTEVCWSPTYPDLFAASYIAGGGPDGKGATGGLLCLHSLKNPTSPERIFQAPSGVTCLHFHPQHSSLVVAGWSDGTVVVYDVKSVTTRTIESSPVTGKHILPVSQVRWVPTDPEEGLMFFSVALDGRVTKWQMTVNLESADILEFDSLERNSFTKMYSRAEDVPLEGRGTCVAFCPVDKNIMLVGVDTGNIIQCDVTAPTHSLIRYQAHQGPVRDLAWNQYRDNLFLSCSADWTVKIWLLLNPTPLIALDVGAAIAGVSWATYSSSVLITATEDGRVNVYDLFLCKTPLCNQNIIKRRKLRLSCLAFSNFYPVVLVGGERGHLITLKLSPNLRKIHKDPRDLEEATPKQIEQCKIDRLISVNR